ncbi:MAG: NAD(+)/NADH kinase [Bacteroidales bacterium]|nr:NAD(+)/NADH kinase [Bacteroidales bacterium]
MKIGLYKRSIEEDYLPLWLRLIETLRTHHIEMVMLDGFIGNKDIDFVISVGGDGTLLSAVHAIGNRGVPVVGLNFGHLGFLTSAGRDHLENFAHDIIYGNYTIEERTLLNTRWISSDIGEAQQSYALNEVYVHRTEHPSLLTTALFVDDEFVANYDADGLIVATPTGSTAYSLSCGGPILTPNSGCFVITPIAAHTLTLRPVIVSDEAHIRLVTKGRQHHFCMGIDSRSLTLPNESEIFIQRAPFAVRLVRMHGQNFYTAIHEKLSWGK